MRTVALAAGHKSLYAAVGGDVAGHLDVNGLKGPD